MARIVLSSVIVSTYTFLTAAELWRERRKHSAAPLAGDLRADAARRWCSCARFRSPACLPDDNGIVALASGWIAIFTLEVMLYIVGTAFIVLVLSKERSVRIHKDAASIDDLTGVLNRRGFMSGARRCSSSGSRSDASRSA